MENKNLTVNDITRKLLSNHWLFHHLQLLFGECSIKVSSNSETLIKKLTHYYKSFVVDNGKPDITVTAIDADPPDLGLDYIIRQPDPGKTKIKEEYCNVADGRIVRKKLTGMIFLFGSGNNFTIGPAEKNDNQVINFINNRYIEWLIKKGCLLSHSAAVSREGRGISIAAFSGMGKSTLALHLMNRGLKFISNDRLLVKRSGDGVKMFGVPKLPRINPGTVLNNHALTNIIPDEEKEILKRMPNDELWNLEQKYDVFIDECFGKNRMELESTLNFIVMLNWKRNGKPVSVNEVNFNERRDLLNAFMKPVGLFFEDDNGCRQEGLSEQHYIESLRGLPVLEFSGGADFHEAAEVCVELLTS